MLPRAVGHAVRRPVRIRMEEYTGYFLAARQAWQSPVPGDREERGVLFSNLTPREKRGLMRRLPKKAKYIRACLRDFWKLKLRPAQEGLGRDR